MNINIECASRLIQKYMHVNISIISLLL